MKFAIRIVFVFLLISVFISACVTFIPLGKYQTEYFKFIKKFRSKPQEHYDKQIEYANYVLNNGEAPKNKQVHIPPKQITQIKTEPPRRKPLYIRDKNNPEILHPYKEEKKERKFLFFRVY
jgi:hypothetical protein